MRHPGRGERVTKRESRERAERESRERLVIREGVIRGTGVSDQP